MSAKPCSPGQMHLFGPECPGRAAGAPEPPRVALAVVRLADLRAHELPERAADIARVVGLAATLVIIERWGGRRLFVPRVKGLRPGHPLVQAVGYRAARALAEYIDGGEIVIPNASRALKGARHRAIRAARGAMTAAECAIAFGITERRVYAIWALESEPE